MDNMVFALPARLKSERLPDKLLLNINGTPIIQLTFERIMQSKYINKENTYVFTDNIMLGSVVEELDGNVIYTNDTNTYSNGSDCIGKNTDKLPEKYTYIMIINCDEPYINIDCLDYMIEQFIEATSRLDTNIYTMYRILDFNEASGSKYVKLVTDIDNNVMYYTRSIVPFNRKDQYDIIMKISVGLLIYPKDILNIISNQDDTPLQKMESVEQLKILELGHKIKCFESPYKVERSIDLMDDYIYFKEKYEVPSSENEGK